MLEVKFEKVGSIQEGVIKVNKLTVLCGENNTGKTYASYAIYGLLQEFLKPHVVYPDFEMGEIGESGQFEIDLRDVLSGVDQWVEGLSNEYSDNLYKIFSTKQETFGKSKVTAYIDKKAIELYIREEEYELPMRDIVFRKTKGDWNLEVSYLITELVGTRREGVIRLLTQQVLDLIIFRAFKKSVFLLPAERAGLNLFYKELNASRNDLIHQLGVDLLNEKDAAQHLSRQINAYALPISDYLSFLNRLESIAAQGTSSFADLAMELERDIVKGSYAVKNQGIYYTPNGSNDDSQSPIHLHVSSSTAKTQVGLAFYLNYMAVKGQYLIIDEPELNLHPDNQRKFARLLAKIVNRGVHVIISTHSDYIVKEFSNLIMLSHDFKSRDHLMEKYGYVKEELLRKEDISPYIFADGKIKLMEVDPVEGIIAETFDQVINRYNEAADDIFYTLQEELNGDGDL